MNCEQKFVALPLTSCLFIDLPRSGFDCATTPDLYNITECVQCNVIQSFFSGESLNDYDSPGHSVIIFLGILTFLFGSFGTLANLLIVLILQRQHNKKVFSTMLMGLAAFDFLCSSTSVISAISAVFYIRKQAKQSM